MRYSYWIVLAFILSITVSCEDPVYPKPRAFHRIDLANATYKQYKTSCPFTFEYNHLAKLDYTRIPKEATCWFNLHYPQLKSRVHFSYHEITRDSLMRVTEDARRMAMEHIPKAQDIREDLIIDTVADVYGVIYDFEGSTATNMQFFITDSSNHFIRAAMYFEVAPNPDSIAPVEAYIKKDMYRFIETFSWK